MGFDELPSLDFMDMVDFDTEVSVGGVTQALRAK